MVEEGSTASDWRQPRFESEGGCLCNRFFSLLKELCVPSIAKSSQAGCVLCSLDEHFLLLTISSLFVQCNQGVGYIAEIG